MPYIILLHPKANKFLEIADTDLRNRIKKKILTLSNRPESGKKLKQSDFWRLRIGDHRAIYEIDHNDEKVIVLYIGHRNEVYDDFSRLF